jgi:rRNA processing protein Gar1
MRTPAVLLALLTLLLAAPVALAHEGDPNYRSVVKGVTPPTEGVKFEILNFDDRVLLHNTSGKDVEIFGYEDEPYAQVKADGTVLVNTNSKAYYLNEDRQGQTSVPQDLSTEPEWKELSKSGRFEWHDHRMHWMGEGDPPQLEDKSQETVIYDNWQIPIAVAGQKGEITGTLTWVPLDGGGLPLGAIFAFAGLIIVLAVAVIVVRRRRGEPTEDGGKEPAEAW